MKNRLEKKKPNPGEYCLFCLFLICWFFYPLLLTLWLVTVWKSLCSSAFWPSFPAPLTPFFLTQTLASSMTDCCKICASIRGVLKCDLQPAQLCQQNPLVWIKTYQQKRSFTDIFSRKVSNKFYQQKWSFLTVMCNWSINTVPKCTICSVYSYLFLSHSPHTFWYLLPALRKLFSYFLDMSIFVSDW